MIVIKVNYSSDAPIIKVNYDDAPIYISTTVDATYIKVDYGTGSGGAAVWGLITGTLSDQTDLQNALDDKVPYTGATGDVDLGEYELKAGQIEFDQSPTGTTGVGVMRWNNTDGTLDLGLKGGNVTLQVGEDIVARVVNKTGGNLLASNYQVVKVSSAQGQRLAVTLAQGNNDNNSADTLGLVIENINNNQEGWIQILGQLTEVNTTGSLQGETWTDGDVLYLSPTTAGALTNVKPVAPQHIVVLGYVEYAHSQHGKIYVKVMNGWELGELHDVDTTGATDGQVLSYDAALGIWKPVTNAAGNIYTTDGTLTGNRTVTMGSFALYFEKDIYVNNNRVGRGAGGDYRNVVLGATNGATGGANNTAVGYVSMNSTTGNGNTAFGAQALYSNTTGIWNSALGVSSLYYTTGTGNTGMGLNTLLNITTGNYNTAIGFRAGQYITANGQNQTSSNSIYVGVDTKASASGNTNEIVIGYQTTGLGSNTTILGNSSTLTSAIYGNLLLGTLVDSGFKLDVQGTGRFTGNVTFGGEIFTPSIMYFNGPSANTGTLNMRFATVNVTNAFNAGITNVAQLTVFSGGANSVSEITSTSGVTSFRITNTASPSSTWYFENKRNAAIGSLEISNSTASPTITLFPSRSVAIGTYTETTSAIFEAVSTTKGFLQPRMTTTQRNAIATPATGLSIYNTTTNTIDYYNGTSWVSGQTSITTGNLTETGSSILTISGGTNAVIGSGTTIQVAQASGSTNGFLSSTDWTTFNNKLSAAVTSLNGLTASSQTFATGTSGTDFNISSTTSTHTFNIPTASATNRGLLSSADWTTFNNKQNALTNPITGTGTSGQVAYWSGTNTQTGSSDFTYNNTNKSIQLSNSTNSGITRGLYLTQTTADGAGNLIILQKSRGGVITSGTTIAAFDGEGFDGSAYQKSARILFAASGTVSSGIVPGTINFLTANSSGVLTSRATINEAGLLSNNGNFQNLGNTLLGVAVDGGQRLQVNGTALFTGSVTGTGNSSTYTVTASSGVARSKSITSTLVAAANNDVLVGLDIAPTFTNGAFTGVSNLGLRVTNADTVLKGSSSSTGTALTVQNGSGIAMLNIRNDQTVQLPVQTNFGNVQFYPTNAGSYVISSVATELRIETTFVNGTTTGDFAYQLGAFNLHNTSNANPIAARIFGTFNPTSGTQTFTNVLFSPTINQTGGANGVTRGLYVNPTLTAAADWRSIEWSNSTGWGLYGVGTANNYFGGRLGLGSTDLTAFNLRVGNNIGGAATSYGIAVTGTIQSTATSSANLFFSQTNTQATAFTLPDLRHFFASENTIGAGSSITNQYAFFAQSSLISATNNFGFYGNIPSGTNRWNLYMNGTAANYLNGNLLIGTTTDGGQKLQVNGDSIMTGSGNTSGTTALTVRNSDNRIIIRAINNGVLQIGNLNANSIYPFSSSVGTPDIQGTSLAISTNLTTSGNGIGIRNAQVSNRDYTSGDGNFVRLYEGYAPTSGTGTWQQLILTPTINQTGGANGITRGLYINPTLTSAADWRAIEVSSGGAYINTTSVNASAILQADSTTKGFLPPRMTTTQKNAIATPAAGLIVFDTTLAKLCVYSGTAWETITSI